jgi:hypothetical protein
MTIRIAFDVVYVYQLYNKYILLFRVVVSCNFDHFMKIKNSHYFSCLGEKKMESCLKSVHSLGEDAEDVKCYSFEPFSLFNMFQACFRYSSSDKGNHEYLMSIVWYGFWNEVNQKYRIRLLAQFSSRHNNIFLQTRKASHIDLFKYLQLATTLFLYWCR